MPPKPLPTPPSSSGITQQGHSVSTPWLDFFARLVSWVFGLHIRGLRADQPAATSVYASTTYFVTDEGVTEMSDGNVWVTYSGPGGGGGIVYVDEDQGLAGDGTIGDPLRVKVDGTSIDFNVDGELATVPGGTAVAVDPDGALDGDGTTGDPLAVRPDGVTIIINGSNQLEAIAAGPDYVVAGNGVQPPTAVDNGAGSFVYTVYSP